MNNGEQVARFDHSDYIPATWGKKVGGFLKDTRGFVRLDAVDVLQSGVFIYRYGDGHVLRELRRPETVLDPECVASLAGIPATIRHPRTDDGLLTAENAKYFQVGMTGDSVQRDLTAGKLSVPVVLTDAEAIACIDDEGVHGTSPGFTSTLDETPGVWNGIPYDAEQKKIRFNHLAIGVGKPRNEGARVVRRDSKDAVIEAAVNRQEGRSMAMVKVKIGEKEIEVEQEVADALTGAQARADSAEAVVQTLTTERDAVIAERDGFKTEKEKLAGRTDSQDEALKGFDKKISDARKDTLTILSDVRRAEKLGARFDDATIAAGDPKVILLAGIKARQPNVDPKALGEKSLDYIRARFDAVEEVAAAEGFKEIADATKGGGGAPDEAKDAEAEYRKRMLEKK